MDATKYFLYEKCNKRATTAGYHNVLCMRQQLFDQQNQYEATLSGDDIPWQSANNTNKIQNRNTHPKPQDDNHNYDWINTFDHIARITMCFVVVSQGV